MSLSDILLQKQLTAKVDDAIYDKDVSVSATKFADDVTGVAVTSTEKQMQTTLQIMAEEFKVYFEAHGLKINITKSEHIIMGSPRTQKIVIDGRQEATQVKLLGLTFNNQYKFDQHATNVVNKISSSIGQIRKISNLATLHTRKELANAVIVSVATYCSEIYAEDQKIQNRVQVKLNSIMRIITNSGNREPIKNMLAALSWMTFTQIMHYSRVMLMYPRFRA